jgi:hypothetical protein
MKETEMRLIKLGVDPTVASKLVTAGIDTPAKMKAIMDTGLKLLLETEEIAALPARYVIADKTPPKMVVVKKTPVAKKVTNKAPQKAKVKDGL